MKVDRYGTPSEALRWSAGWMSPTARATAGEQTRCIDCRYCAVPDYVHHMKGGPKCLLLGLATRSNATCHRYQPATPVDAE